MNIFEKYRKSRALVAFLGLGFALAACEPSDESLSSPEFQTVSPTESTEVSTVTESTNSLASGDETSDMSITQPDSEITLSTEPDSEGEQEVNGNQSSNENQANSSDPSNSTRSGNETVGEQDSPAAPSTRSNQPVGDVAYYNDFSSPGDENRVDNFVHYHNPFVRNHRIGSSDHASTGGVDCSAPEETRPQTREDPRGHVYMCFPGGDPELGHMMAYAMDTTGYGFVGGLPDQVFEGVSEVSVDVNTTTAGSRNFVEIKVLPADQTYVNALPCVPTLPCHNNWDYDDIGGVAGATISQGGTGILIGTPSQPSGHTFKRYGTKTTDGQGDIHYEERCPATGHCFSVGLSRDNVGIRDRFKHTLRDNGDGTISFGIDDDGTTHWGTAPGSFPEGPVRVVVAFHNYTGTKGGNGPGYQGNLSPSTGGFTWHWDELTVKAETSTPSEEFFGGLSADRIVTGDGCIAFSQGSRSASHSSDIQPKFECS